MKGIFDGKKSLLRMLIVIMRNKIFYLFSPSRYLGLLDLHFPGQVHDPMASGVDHGKETFLMVCLPEGN